MFEHADNQRLPFMPLSRRQMLMQAGAGFGYLALQGMLGQQALAAGVSSGTAATPGAVKPVTSMSPLAAKLPHFAAKAKRVIFLFMQGGPSHLDTFDYKPKLQADGGKTGEGKGKLMASPFKFSQHGKSGLWISELYPEVAKHADQMCMLNGMCCDNPAHPQATIQLHTGTVQFVRPSVGAWVLYGLGTENKNLPGFITINPPAAVGGAQNYGSSFLPAAYQGTALDAARGIENIKAPLTAGGKRPG